ncbi:MAG: phosphoribosylformylglycinamidine synthase subunit PurQ / glutaminase [Chloroflexia bacterium]|jgi:phosphoribosylformylglycinamidine synthase|nr:phosphoribosylformylglycinamidine synthase subunit PurQ / glutaminase [Chloroflexia bacterium]
MSTMRVGIVVFPGSNGDHDALYSLGEVLGQRAELVWHTATDLSRYDLVVLPGGFSYGDHLRAGAIARFAPAMEAVRRYAEGGGWVLGICNGFQVLTESHMLPGALMRNAELAFTCRWVHVRVEESRSNLLAMARPGTIWRLPIAHGEGRYFAGPDTLAALEANGQIVLRYCGPDGILDPLHNPNGSSNGIAGICNAEGNVLGLMPHPERAAEAILGGDDGRLFLQSVIEAWQGHVAARPAGSLEAVTSAT